VHCSSPILSKVKRHAERIDADDGGHAFAIDAGRPFRIVVAEPLIDGADGDIFAFALQQLSAGLQCEARRSR